MRAAGCSAANTVHTVNKTVRKNLPEEGDEELHQVHDAVMLRESNLLEKGKTREEKTV